MQTLIYLPIQPLRTTRYVLTVPWQPVVRIPRTTGYAWRPRASETETAFCRAWPTTRFLQPSAPACTTVSCYLTLPLVELSATLHHTTPHHATTIPYHTTGTALRHVYMCVCTGAGVVSEGLAGNGIPWQQGRGEEAFFNITNTIQTCDKTLV